MIMAEEIIFSLYGAVFGAIVGALAAFLLTRHSLNKQERENLKKLQNILSDDFYRNYKYAQDTKAFLTSVLNDEKEFFEHAAQSHYEIERARSPIVIRVPNFRFLLWDAVISSGLIIKLQSHEIVIINATHDNLINKFNEINQNFQQFSEENSLDLENPVTPDIENLKDVIFRFYGGVYARLEQIEQYFEYLFENVSWIQKEFSPVDEKEFSEKFYDIEHSSIHSIPIKGYAGSIKGESKKTPI